MFHTIKGRQHVIVYIRTFFSFKENDEEIKNDTRNNDFISREFDKK